ncbi:prolipoprotein diacylglyceryl transferase [Umezakia ovalisporum]|uniref:Phosphatidylglycerol--prolipoprotein diacylglyceryl transferase n=1 Tax=Umezakia ovalisporum FSS-62 TaxID=2971776 RepID=A0AA43H0K8_9CYAN|nr:prolipoprotein diacylglyceryl transferase [Umezakia ovalisporum]MDH6064959.1 prolipoprotein diacylglyceryl transferase [Umezakia ovalisporum FSS-62]
MVLDILTVLPLGFEFTSPGPVIVDIGPISLRWYGLLIATAVLIGVTLSQYLAKCRCVNPELISDLSIWLVIGAIPTARLYYVLFQWSEYSQHPERIIAIWQGGIAIHGAIIGGILAALIFAKVKQISFWQLADLVAPALILGQAIGRWGNFFNSEAFGRPTNLPWRLYIPPENRPPALANFEYFHPTFLYESVWNLLVFTLLMILFWRDLSGKPRLPLGTIFLVYLVAYSLGRLQIESFRIDSLMLGPLRAAQVVSLISIFVGLALLTWLYILKRPLPDVVPPSTADAEMRGN